MTKNMKGRQHLMGYLQSSCECILTYIATCMWSNFGPWAAVSNSTDLNSHIRKKLGLPEAEGVRFTVCNRRYTWLCFSTRVSASLTRRLFAHLLKTAPRIRAGDTGRGPKPSAWEPGRAVRLEPFGPFRPPLKDKPDSAAAAVTALAGSIDVHTGSQPGCVGSSGASLEPG